jgi:putative glutamine transport system substrate-binding protein
MKRLRQDNFKNIRKVFLILILILSVINVTGCGKKESNVNLLKKIEQRGKLIVGIKYDAKPFGFVDKDRKVKGYDVDLSKEIAKRLLGDENAIEFQQVTSANRIFSINSGNVDFVAATMTITPKRQRIIDFSRPYFIAGQAIMVPKNSSIRYLKDLSGKQVIVVLGTTSEINIKQLVPDVKILGFRTYVDAFNALKTGRGDALTTDDSILYGILADNPKFKILKERLTQEPYGLGFKKGEDTQYFQENIDMILQEISNDGTLRKLNNKWMPAHTSVH